MIKEKELREMRPRVRYQNGASIMLKTIQNALQDYFDEAAIPVAFYADQIKYGGFIGGSTEDCIVLYHPQHENDYYKVAITVNHQGKYAFVSVNDFGSSRQLGNQGSVEYLKETLKFGNGVTTSEKVGALIGAGARRLIMGGVNKQKLQEEQDWYQFVMEAFDEIVAYEN